MPDRYPRNVINKILQITLETQTFAYLALDNDGKLQTSGGDFAQLGLPCCADDEPVLDQLPFLTGFIPPAQDYESIPMIELDDGKIIDAHIFRDEASNWVILVDQTEQLEWQSKARQKVNELNLLKARLAREDKVTANNGEFEFFDALNMVALKQLDGDRFKLLQPVSDSFRTVYPELFEQFEYCEPQDRFPFLENFLVDAHEVWDGEEQRRVYSGPWIEMTPDGEELALEATAINTHGGNLMFIQILDEHYQQHHEFLQIGREGLLLKNYLQQEVRKRTQEIRDREEEIALRLVCAADTRDDGETGSHIRRLGLYSELMAKHLGWQADAVDEIRIAAPMHDIGKIGIPDHILRKPGKLDDSEFQIMKMHAQIGARILSNSKSSLVQMAQEIALGHHEKWDGSGYPFGLVGEQIPMSARIVAIADVFDALVHKRVYKDGMEINEALEILREGRGSHFDPQLFDLFYELREQMADIARNVFDPLCSDIDEIASIVR